MVSAKNVETIAFLLQITESFLHNFTREHAFICINLKNIGLCRKIANRETDFIRRITTMDLQNSTI